MTSVPINERTVFPWGTLKLARGGEFPDKHDLLIGGARSARRGDLSCRLADLLTVKLGK
ncbi:hypothetical protein D3C86_2201830 [compost metagenome]